MQQPLNDMKPINSISIGFWFPIIILFCLLLIIISALGINYYDKQKQLTDDAKEFIINDMLNVQREMESRIRKNEWITAKNILSVRATNSHYQLLVAIDENNTILHATDLALTNKNISALPEFLTAFITYQQLHSSLKISMKKSGQNLLAYLPLELSRLSDEIRSSQVGALVLIYNLDANYQQLWQQTFALSIPLIVFMLIILLFISLFIQHYVLRPIQAIADVAANFSRSNFHDDKFQLCDAKGHGEFAILANVFNDMMIKRKKHEIDLRRSYQQLTKTLTELEEQKYAMDQHSIVAIIDVERTITYANDKFCQISGYSKKELIGQNIKIVHSGYHPESFYQEIYNTINAGHVWNGKICNQNKAGRLYWFESTVVPFTGGGKKPTSFIVIRTDITKHKQVEESLQFALEGARAVVWDWDLLTNKFTYSARRKEMFGFEDIGSGESFSEWENYIHPADKDQCKAKLYAHIEGQKDFYENEHRMLCKDGQYKWVLDRGKVIAWAVDHKPLRVIGTYQDISESKQMDESLKFLQKMDAIGQLTGGIAHDFNNILGIIMGNLELLQLRLSDNPQSDKLVSSAIKAANRATKLTRQLLDFSRSKGNEIQLTNINSLIQEMEDVFLHLAGNQIKLTYCLYDPLWLVELDRGVFHDAIVNFIINSHDAMPNGGVITIETNNVVLDEAFCLAQIDMSAGEYVEITIRDNGCGIPLKIQQQIFEPFYTTKPPGKGTGLGLAMVFGFVKRFNGGITISSEVGVGTTFKIFLPKASCTLEKTSDIKRIEDRKNIEKIKSSADETLLIVDDENELVNVAKESLKQLGYNIFIANNARQALGILAKKPDVALVFSDVVMAGSMNGFQLAKKITELYPHVKILLTSGYTGKAAMEQEFDETQHPLLYKPYSQNDLASKVRELLGESQISRAKTPRNDEKNIGFQWRDEYMFGLASVDVEHQQLFVLMNKCLQANDNNKDLLPAAINELLNYTKDHFAHEEQLMKSSGYPNLKNHRQIHQLLLKQFTKQKNEVFKDALKTEKLISFFHNWFVEHSINLDKVFVNYYLTVENKQNAAENKGEN